MDRMTRKYFPKSGTKRNLEFLYLNITYFKMSMISILGFINGTIETIPVLCIYFLKFLYKSNFCKKLPRHFVIFLDKIRNIFIKYITINNNQLFR